MESTHETETTIAQTNVNNKCNCFQKKNQQMNIHYRNIFIIITIQQAAFFIYSIIDTIIYKVSELTHPRRVLEDEEEEKEIKNKDEVIDEKDYLLQDILSLIIFSLFASFIIFIVNSILIRIRRSKCSQKYSKCKGIFFILFYSLEEFYYIKIFSFLTDYSEFVKIFLFVFTLMNIIMVISFNFIEFNVSSCGPFIICLFMIIPIFIDFFMKAKDFIFFSVFLHLSIIISYFLTFMFHFNRFIFDEEISYLYYSSFFLNNLLFCPFAFLEAAIGLPIYMCKIKRAQEEIEVMKRKDKIIFKGCCECKDNFCCLFLFLGYNDLKQSKCASVDSGNINSETNILNTSNI